MSTLDAAFFNRATQEVARDLLGKYLYRRTADGRLYRAIISETEAYHGTEDLGCHCAKGYTPRTSVMFGPPGRFYVYLIYGMYEMLNVVTMPEGFPSAVLIRGLTKPQILTDGRFEDVKVKTDGPGKLTRWMQIDRRFNGLPAAPETGLWIADEGLKPKKIKQTPRIGIDYAGEWKHKPWRYVLEEW